MRTGAIEWGVSWNPVKGKCPHRCGYCYMEAYFRRFKLDPTLRRDEKVLAHPPKAERIFVCSSLDLFANQIRQSWIHPILVQASKYKDRDFFFLTKNPNRYRFQHDVRSSNIWYGTTCDGLPFTRFNIERLIKSAPPWGNLFASYEPLIVEPQLLDIRDGRYLNWVIIGADSRPGVPKPPKEWADKIIEQARGNRIPVFVKSNYGYPGVIQEFPAREAMENESERETPRPM